MHWLFAKHFWRTIGFLLIILVICAAAYTYLTPPKKIIKETIIILPHNITETITVSGKVAAEKTTVLSFPVGGTIKQVNKRVGDKTTESEIIASLTTEAVTAEYESLRNRLFFFEQAKEKTVRGNTDTEKAVADAQVTAAQVTKNNVNLEFTQAMTNTYQTLLSTDLQAYPTYGENNDIPPTISGTYTCPSEGVYRLQLFNSNSPSGISYTLSGIENGTFVANVDTPLLLGTCGLYIKFSPLESYRSREWIVSIPNTRSSQYSTLKNAYDLIKTQAITAGKEADEALKIAIKNKEVVYATATPETIAQAEANILEIAAQLRASESRIADYIIKAPYAGVISAVAMHTGESVTPERTITLAYLGAYELEAQIPEIDITKITINNTALVRFDAKPHEEIPARVTFISPIATEVGGVAYYKTRIRLEQEPSWIREGLNADINIITEEKKQVPAVPKRFIMYRNDSPYVITPEGQEIFVSLDSIGTNDYIEIGGVEIGTAVIVP